MTQAHWIPLTDSLSGPCTFNLGESYFREDICAQDWVNFSNDPEQALVPHFGSSVSCGLFGISDDYIEKYQSLDSRFVKNRASTFFLQQLAIPWSR